MEFIEDRGQTFDPKLPFGVEYMTPSPLGPSAASHRLTYCNKGDVHGNTHTIPDDNNSD